MTMMLPAQISIKLGLMNQYGHKEKIQKTSIILDVNPNINAESI